MTIDVDPILVHLGPFTLTWYGVFVGLALIVATWLALREAKRKGLPPQQVESLALWVVLGGVIGARALHVIDRWELYAPAPLSVFAIWNGGLAIMGGVLGGTVAGVFVAWGRGLPVLQVADAAAPAAILGQGIGRLACLFTGDAVGRVTNGFGVTYLNPGAMVSQLGVAYEPVFLYEMTWDFGVFALLWWVRGRVRTDGYLFAIYLAAYALGKFVLSFRRAETVWVASLQGAQLLSIAGIGLALAWAWASARRASTARA